MVKVRKRTNSIEPEKVQQEPDEVDSVSDTSEKTSKGCSVSNNVDNDEPKDWNKVLYIRRSYCFVSKYQMYGLHFQMLERIALMDGFVKDTEEENSASDDLQAIVSVLSQYNRANLGQFVANAGQSTYRNQRATV